MKTLAIIFLVFASAVLAQKFLGEEPVLGGLHDYIFTMPRETLINWALATEKYHRKIRNEILFGGLDDYINTLSNNEIANYILKEADEHPEIANKDKLNALTTEFGLGPQVSRKPFGGDGGLHDYIWRLPREQLTTWALASEAYHREVTHAHLVGGLDDYIGSLTNEQIIDYILAQVKEHPELATQGKLDSLVKKYNITPDSDHSHVLATKKAIGGDGGLHDIIWRTDRKTLNKWALTTEKYHREVKNQVLFGGLHDYIDALSNEQVIQYILTQTKEHPELANVEKLNSLSGKYGITGDSEHKPTVQFGGDGGLHDFIFRLPRTTLDKWAFAAEKYHANGQTLIGGLHDYIGSWTNQQVIEYILKQVKEHPEIGNANKLDSLVAEYGFNDPSVSKGGLIGGGIHDYVQTLDRNSLIAWALAMDEYSHEKNPRLGGIDDYVNSLKDQEIRNFILKQAENYPELNNRSTVEGLIKRFNIIVKN